MLFSLICRSFPLLLPVIRSSLHPHYLLSLNVRLLLIFLIPALHLLAGVVGSVLFFISPGSVRASVVCLFRYLLLSGCFQKGPGIC